MIIISDTSPLNYLVLIDEIDLLEKIYQSVIIPSSVYAELNHQKTSQKVRNWLAEKPNWLIIKSAVNPFSVDTFGLDIGETEAIQIALELKADLVIIDERNGRKIAQEQGLKTIGIIGILIQARDLNLIEINQVLAKLEQTTFRISKELKEILRESE
ncbi:MAG: DUF3368 domain-containing protein [Pyrinomonadaceae bacterium]|jgi:predicted nucleic acid-binding protein|nr:DUF3368 domain-containing protein [Pyrinomonadaceae bacterium]